MIRHSISNRLSSDATRFLVAGLINTGLTLLVYQALLFVMTPALAYAGSWVAGLAYVALVYPDRVFKGGRRTTRDRLLVAASYCGVFLAGLGLLFLLEKTRVPPRLGIVAVILVTTILNFLSSRVILRR
jgi:putative flippase GtrA